MLAIIVTTAITAFAIGSRDCLSAAAATLDHNSIGVIVLVAVVAVVDVIVVVVVVVVVARIAVSRIRSSSNIDMACMIIRTMLVS